MIGDLMIGDLIKIRENITISLNEIFRLLDVKFKLENGIIYALHRIHD